MNNSSFSKFSLFVNTIILSFSVNSYALDSNEANVKSATNITVPVIDNAQIFADFTDELPAVLNYFTQATEAQIIDFYQQHYGNVLSQEEKHDRLRLTYEHEDHLIRVIISPQNKKRQVDIIIESKEE
jgi:hypothetical protein